MVPSAGTFIAGLLTRHVHARCVDGWSWWTSVLLRIYMAVIQRGDITVIVKNERRRWQSKISAE